MILILPLTVSLLQEALYVYIRNVRSVSIENVLVLEMLISNVNHVSQIKKISPGK